MASIPKYTLSPDQYLKLERAAETRSEYYYGEMFAMAGNTIEHVTIAGNIFGELRAALKGEPCSAYTSDLRVKISDNAYAYPDVSVACGPQFLDNQFDTLVNPTVIVEVLSPSTEAYDRGGKFAHYRGIRSLQQYILVSQLEPRVEYFTRQADDQWLLGELLGLDGHLVLSSINTAVAMSEVYSRVSFNSSVSSAQ